MRGSARERVADVREPEIREYWPSDETFRYSPISSPISHRRFEEVSRYLHFINNDELPAWESPGFHRLQRVNPVIDSL